MISRVELPSQEQYNKMSDYERTEAVSDYMAVSLFRGNFSKALHAVMERERKLGAWILTQKNIAASTMYFCDHDVYWWRCKYSICNRGFDLIIKRAP